MTDTSFTPGPWSVDQLGFNVVVHSETGSHTVAMTQPGARMKADALLIAAAPDMLAALRAAEQCIGKKSHPANLRLVRAAIAKATHP